MRALSFTTIDRLCDLPYREACAIEPAGGGLAQYVAGDPSSSSAFTRRPLAVYRRQVLLAGFAFGSEEISTTLPSGSSTIAA